MDCSEEASSDEKYFSANEKEQDDRSSHFTFKPLPWNKRRMMREAQQLGLLKPNPKVDTGRKELLSHVYSSYKIKRSYKQMSILLIGSTGVGKSSTVNHLFNFKRDGSFIEFAKTSKRMSTTRSTTEYLIKTTSEFYEVKDLSLGVVDSPGFSDTSGTKQDACNFYSIKKFFEEHPKLKGYFPNLVLISVKGGENRTEGPNSALSKTLKLLSKLNLVDKAHPNVVGVITHAVHLGPKLNKFKLELADLSDCLQKAIFEHLQVLAPVVAIENDILGQELDKDDEWTLLVDGTQQPLNLFITCNDLLKKSGDPFGQLVFSECFKKCSEPEVGFQINAKDAEKENLSKTENKFHDEYRAAIEGGVDNGIVLLSKDFIEHRGLNDRDRYLVRKTASDIIAAGFRLDTVKEMSVDALSFLIERVDESPIVRDFMLHLGVQEERPVDVCDSAIRVIGQGYNVMSRQTVTSAIFSYGKRNTKSGLLVPDTAGFARANETFEFMEFFESEEEMQRMRMQALNINFHVDSDAVGKFQGAGGYNRIRGAGSQNVQSDFSFLFEQRLFELRLESIDELKVTQPFLDDVIDLPTELNIQDSANRLLYESFFEKWGHFLVTRAYGGGSVELKISKQSKGWGSLKYDNLKAEILSSISIKHSDAQSRKSREILERSTSQWKGGDSSLHKRENFSNEEAMSKWKISLMSNPVMLEHSMSLLPIPEIVRKVDKDKYIACSQALRAVLGGEFKVKNDQHRAQQIREKRETDEQLKEEKARSREEAAKNSQPVNSLCVLSKNSGDICIQMKDLNIGDRVMTLEGGKVVYQKVITFLHRDLDVEAEFVKITFDNGSELTVTGNHLLLTRRENCDVITSKPACDVEVGDVDVMSGEGERVRVVRVESERHKGIFCPLTESGTIVVDGILCSCYASVRSFNFGLFQISGHKVRETI